MIEAVAQDGVKFMINFYTALASTESSKATNLYAVDFTTGCGHLMHIDAIAKAYEAIKSLASNSQLVCAGKYQVVLFSSVRAFQ